MPSLATSVAVPSSSNRIIRAVPLPKYRSAFLVTAANTTSGGSPRATSMARRRSDACVSASARSLSSASALVIAMPASSMNSATALNTSSGPAPAATSVVTRRSAACCPAS